jgi:hypothetical protein
MTSATAVQLSFDDMPPWLGAIALHSPQLHRLEAIQQRVRLDQARIADYADLYREGRDLGQVTVFQDGLDFYVADGFHRITAALDAGLVTLPALIRPGGRREALLYACSCNLHGVPLHNADKRRRVVTMLRDPEWGTWSDHAIAHHCGVSHTFVGKVRASLATVASDEARPPTARVYRNRYGQTTTMHTADIGQRADRCAPTAQAPAPLLAEAAPPRTLINCLNTGSQKVRKCTGMCSESV